MNCRGVCQTVGLWFIVWVKGKFGDWGASVLLRIQECKKKCGVGALQEDYVCLHRAIPFMPVAVCIAEQRETDRLLNRR